MRIINQTNNKGFTLTELLGVIVILTLLVLLVFPAVMNQMKDTKDAIDDSVEKIIFNGAQNYMNSHTEEYPKTDKKTYCFTLKTLVDAKEISEGLLIDRNGKALDLTKKVEVYVTSSKITYKMNDSCIGG